MKKLLLPVVSLLCIPILATEDDKATEGDPTSLSNCEEDENEGEGGEEDENEAEKDEEEDDEDKGKEKDEDKTTPPLQCVHESTGVIYNELDEVPNENPCNSCQCSKRVIHCAKLACEVPKFPGDFCWPLQVKDGECCPEYECDIPGETD